jgi:tetratricopeptide (TPR) repeat protein
MQSERKARVKATTKEHRKKIKEGRKALIRASKIAYEGRPKTAEAKVKARTLAFHALVEVEKAFLGTLEIQAEAAFRQGKLLALLGRSKDAIAAYRRAGKLLPQTYSSKALIQAGHVMRRMKKLGDALKYYRSAIKANRGLDAQRSAIWEGKILAKLGRLEDARKSWKSLCNSKDADPFLRIQAFDTLAGSYLREGDLHQVRIILKDADETLASLSSPEEKLGKKIQGRLSRMSSRRRLRQKLEKAAASKSRK